MAVVPASKFKISRRLRNTSGNTEVRYAYRRSKKLRHGAQSTAGVKKRSMRSNLNVSRPFDLDRLAPDVFTIHRRKFPGKCFVDRALKLETCGGV